MEALRKVDKYLLLEELEKTGLGGTWRSAEVDNGKIKKYFILDSFNIELASDKGFQDHYLTQSQVSAKLEHPNILRKIAAIHDGVKLASVHEHQEGFSLARVLKRCKTDQFPFSIDHALLVTSKILSALSYAKSKHLTHGFVNPSMIFVTHEGEIKIKGFALSSAMRHCTSGAPKVNFTSFKPYVPRDQNVLSPDHDLLDIHGCGSILFEMLTGKTWTHGSEDVATRVANAVTDAESEAIPTNIANILVSSLDPSAPSAYGDIHKMTKDMEELLYSGEYSPTTFNLAFFMHSAFRSEMEELNEKITQEKARTYSEQSLKDTVPLETLKTATAPTAAVGSVPPASPTRPEVSTAKPPPPAKKSKMPIILGAVAAIVVIAVVVVFFLPKSDTSPGKFETTQAELKQEASILEAERLKEQQQELERQNEILRLQLQQQAEEERERKKREVEDNLREVDKEIARLKALEEQEKKQKDLETQLATLKQQQQDLEAQQKRAEVEEAQQEQTKTAVEAGDEPADPTTDSGQPQDVPTPENTTQIAKNTATPNDATVDPEPATTIPEKKEEVIEEKPPTPPQPGELVSLDDQDLKHPELLEPYQIQDAPRKAVRTGIVKRDHNLLFLMRVLVDEEGRVQDAALHQSPLKEGQSDYGMLARAEKVVRKYKFSAPTKLGVKVKVWIIVPVHFRGK